MARRRRRGRSLRRRYGHFGFKDVHDATSNIRKLAQDNPLITAAGIGAAGATLAAGMPAHSAAILGAVAGIAAEQAIKK